MPCHKTFPTHCHNQHQPTNINHPTNRSNTQRNQPTSTNINQQTNQQPILNNQQTKNRATFPSLKCRIPRDQGVGPKHAKIQKSDHLSVTVIGWIDGWGGRENVHPTGDGCRLKTNNNIENGGNFSPTKFATVHHFVGWMLGMYFFSDFLMSCFFFKLDQPDVRDICWIFIFNWK